jgi:hypothetical protein
LILSTTPIRGHIPWSTVDARLLGARALDLAGHVPARRTSARCADVVLVGRRPRPAAALFHHREADAQGA